MLLLLIFSFDVDAHNDSFSQDTLDPLIPLDTFETCYSVKAKTGFAVRYNQFAQVFFRAEIPSYNTNFIISSNVNPSLNFDIDTLHYGENEPDELLLKINQANLNEAFQLSTINSCGDTLFLREVSTSPSNTSSVTVSHDLFYALERKSGDTSLYQVLENDNAVIFEEKLSFVQKYFFNDSLFAPTSIDTGLLDTLPVNHSGVLPCYCKMITGEPILEPFEWGEEFYGSYKRHHFPYVLMQNEQTQYDDWSTIQSYLNTGPAKYINNHNQGKCTGSKYSYLGTDDGNNSPNFTSLQIYWACVQGPYGEWCGDEDDQCEKVAYYSVKYDTRLQAFTQLRNVSWFCGTNKGARSRAEDYAALILKDSDGNFEVLEADRAGVASEANKSYSTDWFLNTLEFTVAVLRIALGDQSAWIDLVDPTVEFIEGLITTDFVTKDGAEDQDLHFGLINNNTGSFTLKPNVLTELMLISAGITESAGYTGWKATSRINSNYRLAVAVPGGVANAPSEYCCSDGFSAWSLATIFGAPVNYPPLFNSVNAFFATLNLAYNQNDLGSATTLFNCPNPNETESESRGEIQTQDNSTTASIGYYQVFDLSGRLIFSDSNFRKISDRVISVQKPKHSGMYIAVAHLSDGSFVSSKFFVASNHHKNEIYVSFK